MNDDYRPDPDRILDGIKKAEEAAYRGHLRIFFGMCPGVGKTYAMLEAAQEQHRQGVNIVVGVVETHGRKETESLLLGLELIPRKKISYKDSTLEEMDIDAILKRKPEIVLVDELAHSNAPTSRHQKRYQDVLELLDAGIHVYTTVNVQHIESRADLVQQITGVRIFERVPDSVIDQAQQIELVDISAQNLRKRLKEGKVYQGDRAAKAGENFFKETHLLALRELALRYTAEKVDQDLQDQMVVQRVSGPWNTQERLLVAVGHSPYSARLIRATRRMAYGLEAPWIALYVDTGEQLNPEDQAMLNKNLALARELGAEVVAVRESNIVEAIHRTSHERNVTQIILGRPVGRWWDFVFRRGSLLDQLVRRSSLVDIHVIRQEEQKVTKKFRLAPPVLYAPGASYWNAFWFVGGVTFISEFINPYIGYRAVGFVFLLAILLMGFLSTLGPILFAAILSVLVWNFLFIPPKFTFNISAPEDVMMCFAYLFVALMGGLLTTKVRRRDRDLLQRDQYNRALLEMVQDMSTAVTKTEVAFSAEQKLETLLNGKIKILFSDMDGKLERRTYNAAKLDEKDLALALWSFENRKKAGWKTDTLTESRCLSLPLRGKNSLEGVMLFYPRVQNPLSLDQESLIETVALQLGASLERLKLQDTLQDVKVLEASEKLHQALLNSVSHELRTPLTAIMGSASALQDQKLSAEQPVRQDLIDSVIDSSRRLDQVVENLLDMSRLNSGVLTPKKVWVDLVDFCDVLVQKMKPIVRQHDLVFNSAETECLLQIDEKFFEHALSNLILNAAKYSAAHSSVQVSLSREERVVFLIVRDEGDGIPANQLEKIFEAFHRIPGSAPGGVGLGLAIVRSFIEAHNGKVYARNRGDRKGAEFVIELPYENPPSALTSEGRL
ncbi:ATP-binding protein [Bdellovibrio sp. HCB209]|uniref:ATP-binding protein n=1 Tax=Bdellovibrio sp. HCB209 TaxID=3394354 RepID=UPI0039B41C5B